MSRIVVAMIDPPLPFGGAASRWFYVLLKGLVDRGHRVTAFAAAAKPEESEKAQALFPKPHYDLRCYPFPHRTGLARKLETMARPYSFMFSEELKRDLRRELDAGFDLLHLEQLWSAWLGLEHVDRALVNVHHLMSIDLSEEIARQSFARRQQIRLMWATERRLLRKLRYVRSCSPRLVPHMLATNPTLDVTTVPVGIEPEQYPYISDDRRTKEPVISVIGTMAWHPTRSAAVRLLTRLWPQIKRRIPAARVLIVGWNAKSMLSEYIELPDVTIAENVPDIRPYFERTGVLLYAPGRGSGMKIKILEAMAFGVPVVTTSEGVEGIPALDGVHAGVCEDDAGLIDRAVAILNDIGLQNRQRLAARALFERHCGPQPTLDAIEAIYSRMVSAKAEAA